MSKIVKKRSKSRVSGVDRFLTIIRVLMATLIVIGIVAFWHNKYGQATHLLTGETLMHVVSQGINLKA